MSRGALLRCLSGVLLFCWLVGCAQQVSYVREDHPLYPTEAIFPQAAQQVWQASVTAMAGYPLAVQDRQRGVIQTEWLFSRSDVTRQVVRQGGVVHPEWMVGRSDTETDGDVVESSHVQIRQRITLTMESVGVGTRVAIHQEVLENRPYPKGVRRYYAPDNFVEAPSSTALEHRLLEQIRRFL